jgi:DNA-binding LytR/AlgR family response regulator
MKALIVEIPKPDPESLREHIRAADPRIEIMAVLSDRESVIRYFRRNPQPDLLFLETDPASDLYGSLLRPEKIGCPVVYLVPPEQMHTTGTLPNCLDVLIRPLDTYQLRKCIRHYRELQEFFIRNHSSLYEHFNGKEKLRSRILVKKGNEYQTCRISDVAYFFSDHKLVFLVDKENRKYLTAARSLSELQDQLDRNIFYRANRKFIVNVNYIQVFSMADSSRIRLKLLLPVNEPILISQQNTACFKQWMGEKL